MKSNGDIDGGKTVLHWAAMKGRESIVTALLEKMTIDLVDAQDNSGRTAIMCAVDKNAQVSVKQLLVDAKRSLADDSVNHVKVNK